MSDWALATAQVVNFIVALGSAYYLGRRRGRKDYQPARDDRGRFVKR